MASAVIRFAGPLLLIAAPVWSQQYKAGQAGPPPTELAPAIAQALNKTGFQISNNGAAYCEIWFRMSLPSGAPVPEQNVTLPNIPAGSLLGVIRFDANGSDRRGQAINAGVYTLRYARMPMSITHQGAAPQRDFLLMIPAEADRDLNAIPNFDTLVEMSRKASRSAHPAILSLWKADADSPGFSQRSDSEWVLQSTVGDTPIVLIVTGTASS